MLSPIISVNILTIEENKVCEFVSLIKLIRTCSNNLMESICDVCSREGAGCVQQLLLRCFNCDVSSRVSAPNCWNKHSLNYQVLLDQYPSPANPNFLALSGNFVQHSAFWTYTSESRSDRNECIRQTSRLYHHNTNPSILSTADVKNDLGLPSLPHTSSCRGV
jgi:hypothetical protein